MSKDLCLLTRTVTACAFPEASTLPGKVLMLLDPVTGKARFHSPVDEPAAEALLPLMRTTPHLLIEGGKYQDVTYLTAILRPECEVNAAHAERLDTGCWQLVTGALLYLNGPLRGCPEPSDTQFYGPATGPLTTYELRLTLTVNQAAKVNVEELLKGVNDAISDYHSEYVLWGEKGQDIVPTTEGIRLADHADLHGLKATLIGVNS